MFPVSFQHFSTAGLAPWGKSVSVKDDSFVLSFWVQLGVRQRAGTAKSSDSGTGEMSQ